MASPEGTPGAAAAGGTNSAAAATSAGGQRQSNLQVQAVFYFPLFNVATILSNHGLVLTPTASLPIFYMPPLHTQRRLTMPTFVFSETDASLIQTFFSPIFAKLKAT